MFKRLKQIKKDESGASSILVVICLVVMLGFTAMAVDVGNAYNRKVDMQDACDLSALAAADSLPDSDATEQLAKQYAQKNGYDEEDVTVSILDGGEKVEVKIAQDVKTYFASVVGYKTLAVSCKSVAAAGEKGAGDYAIFSGNEIDFGLYGNVTVPQGDVHANGETVGFSGSLNIPNGTLEVRMFDEGAAPAGNYGKYVNANNIVDMPDYSEIITKRMRTVDDSGYQEVDGYFIDTEFAKSHINGKVLTIKSNEKVYVKSGLNISPGNGVDKIVVEGVLKVDKVDYVAVPLIVNGDMIINGVAGFDSDVVINGSMTANKQLQFRGNAEISGTVVAAESITFSNKVVLDSATIVCDSGEVNFAGSATVTDKYQNGGYSVIWARGNDTHININPGAVMENKVLLYAPKGMVYMNGTKMDIKGSITGDRIGTNNGDMTVELPKNDPNWEFGGQSKDKKRSSSAKLVG